MLNLTKDNFDSVTAKGKVLIDFYTDWCGYCKILSPVLEELSTKYAGSVTVAKVDADTEREIADRYDIKSYPTILLLEDGKEVDRKIGVYPLEVFEEMMG